MKHIESSQIADYVRGLLDRDTAAGVSSHLESGCGRCERLAQAFARVTDLAAAESRSTPDEGTVRSVKALFAVRQADLLPASRWLTLEPLAVGGLAPAGLAPAAAGVRGGHDLQRFTYGGDGFELGILIETPPGRESASLTAELLHSRQGHRAGVPAILTSGSQVVGQVTTDELGAFRLGLEVEQARLSLLLDDDRLVALEIDAPVDIGGSWSVRPARCPSSSYLPLEHREI